MMCYKDKTFCYSGCINKDCHRFFSDEIREGARKWWSRDPDNAPIAFSDFSETCPVYMKPKQEVV